jgi:hypothetical protein
VEAWKTSQQPAMRGFIITRTQRIHKGSVGVFSFKLPKLTVVDTIKIRPSGPSMLLVTTAKWEGDSWGPLAYPQVPAELFSPDAMRCPLYIGPLARDGGDYFTVKLLNNGNTGVKVMVGAIGSMPTDVAAEFWKWPAYIKADLTSDGVAK